MREGEIVTRNHVRLAELIDTELAREGLNILSRATGAPIELRDNQGMPLFGGEHPSAFCSIIRSSRYGMDICRKRGIAHCPGTVGESAEYTTNCGISHAVAPILLDDKRIGVVVIGPFLRSTWCDAALRNWAQILGVPEDQLVEAARAIPVLSEAQIGEVRNLLSPLSIHLSVQVKQRAKSLELDLERQRGIEEISLLRHIVNIVNSGLDVEKTLKSIAEFAVQMTRSDAAIIRLLERDSLVSRGSVGIRAGDYGCAPIAVGEGVTGRVVVERRPISLVDIQSSEEMLYAKFLQKENLHGYLSVPIKIRGRVIGVLTTFKRKRYRYLEDDVRRLSLLADETAMAVDNALLYEERVRAEKRASLLAEAGKIFSSSLDIDQVLQTIAEKIGESLDVLCTVTLPSESGRNLIHKAVYCRNPAKIDLLRKMVEEKPLRIGLGLSGCAFKTGKLLFIDGGGPDTFPDPDRPYFRAIGMRSAIAVPLRTKDRVFGALVVAIVDSDRKFEDADLVLVQNLAELAAIAVENAQLYRRAEAERVRLEAVISGMADGVLIVDKDGSISAINRAGREIFGQYWDLDPEDGLEAKNLTTKNGRYNLLEDLSLKKVLNEGVSVIQAEMTFQRDDGELRVCQVSAAPVLDHRRAIAGAVAVFRDITATKEIERLKDELISVVSHEFRAPLTAISGYTQMLIRQLSKRENVDRELGEANLVLAHTQRLAGMVRDLLDISRIESGQFSLKRRIAMLPDLIGAVVDRHSAISDAHKITVRAPKDFPPMYVDPERVEQILDNLISNAIKYSPSGGQVLITVKLNENGVVVSVRDWGIGIDHRYLSRLFERFYRVDNRESREFEGIGLGLHIVKLLVEAHKGNIWVRSRKGQGSTFSFSLPLVGGKSE